MKKIILIALVASQAIFAQNLVANGTFDANTDGWSAFNDSSTTLSWVADDGNTANGSLQISDNFNNGGTGTIHSEKVPIIAETNYKLKGFTRPFSDSEAQGSGIFISWYNDDFQISTSDFIEVSNATANNNWTAFEQIFKSPVGATFAEIRLGVQTQNSESTDPAIARYDDIRFELFTDNPDAFAMVPGHSALWYNRDQSGHGFNVYLLADQGIIVIWYAYDNLGNPLWLLGIGTHDGVKATLSVKTFSGGMLPPNFDPDDVTGIVWGTFELVFTGCDTGVFKWMPEAGNGFTAGELDVIRLNTTLGLSCTE